MIKITFIDIFSTNYFAYCVYIIWKISNIYFFLSYFNQSYCNHTLKLTYFNNIYYFTISYSLLEVKGGGRGGADTKHTIGPDTSP
jgi:hypothetical protein